MAADWVSEARQAISCLDRALDLSEAQRLERDELRMVIDDLRAVMSVAPQVPDGHLADLLWERLRSLGGTTDGTNDEDRHEDPAA